MGEETRTEDEERLKRMIMDHDPGRKMPEIIEDNVFFRGKEKDDEERERTGNRLWSWMVKVLKW